MSILADALREVDTDVGSESLEEQEVPCEIGLVFKEHGEPAAWCTEVAEWRFVVRCTVCGKAKQALMCTGCKKIISTAVRIYRVVIYFLKTDCGHRGRHKVATWVPFKG